MPNCPIGQHERKLPRENDGSIGGTAVRTNSLTCEQMETRVARFQKLETYQNQNFETHNIPPGAVEKVAARRVYPVMVPPDYQGRSAGAPVKGPRGLIVSIAECEPGNGPGLHRHLSTVENFFCISGRFEIAWGDQGEHTLVKTRVQTGADRAALDYVMAKGARGWRAVDVITECVSLADTYRDQVARLIAKKNFDAVGAALERKRKALEAEQDKRE